MSDFPAYSACPYTADSDAEILDDLQIDEADDGTIRSRAFYAAPKRRFNLDFRLTTTQYATLKTHYAANRTGSFNFVWQIDGLTYTCRYEKAGPREKAKGSLIYTSLVLRSE